MPCLYAADFAYNKEQQCLEQRIEKKASLLNLSGLKVLTLVIEKAFFEEIVSGVKTEEYRSLKQNTLNKYTYVDEADGRRYLRRFDVIRFYVGYHSDRDNAVVQVLDTTYENSLVTYHLGKVLEVIRGKR